MRDPSVNGDIGGAFVSKTSWSYFIFGALCSALYLAIIHNTVTYWIVFALLVAAWSRVSLRSPKK